MPQRREKPASCPVCHALVTGAATRCPSCGADLPFASRSPTESTEDIPSRAQADDATITPIGIAQTDPLEGATFGDFHVLRLIGRGGMAAVYECRQESLRRTVALKILDVGVPSTTADVARFEREAWIGGKLNHPNIVRVFAQGSQGPRYYIAMELIDGPSLHEEITRVRRTSETTPLDPSGSGNRERLRNLVSLFLGVTDALDYVHRQGVVHRDIKPLNLLLTGDGARLLISDFGLARSENASVMTRRGDFLGTIRYMSPEQLLAHRVKIDSRSDIYSLGVSLYEAITLSLPYDAPSEEAYISAVSSKEPVPARARVKALPRELETILMKCLEKDRDRRYQSAGELRDDLQRWLDGRPVLARRAGAAVKILRLASKQRTGIIVAVCAAATVISAVEIGKWQSRKASELRRIEWTLTEVQDKRKPPEELQPDWASLESRLDAMVSRRPSGPLAIQATRAATAVRVELPAFALLSQLPDFRFSAMPLFDPGRDFLCRTEVQASWDGAPFRPIQYAVVRWESGRSSYVSYSQGEPGTSLAAVIPAPLLQAGPHRIELRANLTVLDVDRNSLLWREALNRDSGGGESWQREAPPPMSDIPELFRESRALEPLTITLFDKYPDSFPLAVVENEGTPPVESWFRPDSLLLFRVTLPVGAGERYRANVDRTCQALGEPPAGADPHAGFPGGVLMVIQNAEGLVPEIPIAARVTIQLPGRGGAIAGLPFAYGKDELWLGDKHSAWTARGGSLEKPSIKTMGLFSSIRSNDALPWCVADLPPDGLYTAQLALAPSRDVALETRRFDRYFGRELTFPVKLEIRTIQGMWADNDST